MGLQRSWCDSRVSHIGRMLPFGVRDSKSTSSSALTKVPFDQRSFFGFGRYQAERAIERLLSGLGKTYSPCSSSSCFSSSQVEEWCKKVVGTEVTAFIYLQYTLTEHMPSTL
jgi:hypothetical protein